MGYPVECLPVLSKRKTEDQVLFDLRTAALNYKMALRAKIINLAIFN